MMKQQPNNRRRNVTKIKNEYVRTKQQQDAVKRARKVRLYRRLAVFAAIVLVSFGILANIYVKQQKVLAEKKTEKEMLIEELALHEKERDQLAKQLEKLNDDEYIAKLARQEYFLSDKNEIIFSLPKKEEKEEKKQKKDKEKE